MPYLSLHALSKAILKLKLARVSTKSFIITVG